MLLTQENISHYLLERDTIKEERIVDGDFVVLPIGGSRNNLFKVLSTQGRSLFIKQVAKFDPVTISVLTREANTYRFLFQSKLYPEVTSRLPVFVDHDKYRHVLTVEYFAGASNIQNYFLQHRAYFPELAIQQAELLHSYHTPIPEGVDLSIFPKALPWVLQVHDFTAAQLFPDSTGNDQIINIVQSDAQLKKYFQELKEDYKMTTLVHGDIKWSNFIIYPYKDGMKQSLIDWELADLGDPCWDVAGLLQSYISTWIFSFDNMDPWSKTIKANMQDFDINNMQRSIESFWTTYARLMQLDEKTGKEMLIKCIRFTAARIIQTSIEGVVYTPHVYPNNVRSVQIAFNILKSPETAITELLGIKI